MNKNRWTEAEQERFLELIESGEDFAQIASILNQEFNSDRSEKSCFWYNQRMRRQAKNEGKPVPSFSPSLSTEAKITSTPNVAKGTKTILPVGNNFMIKVTDPNGNLVLQFIVESSKEILTKKIAELIISL